MSRFFNLITYILLYAQSVLSTNTISCFLNMNGPCSKNSPVYDSVAMNQYLNRYNKFIKDCNFNTIDVIPNYIVPVVDTVLNMPCEGMVPFSKTYNANYSFNKCGLMEIYSVQQACINANEMKRNLFLKNNNPFINIVYNLPSTSCDFLGMGTVEFDKTENSVWIQSSRLFNPNLSNTLVHEIGHTKGLHHSGAYGSKWEYADCSCPMGCAGTIDICYSPPNANLLGWAKPIQMQKTINKWTQLFLPFYVSRLYNHILVDNGNGCKLFFSVRSSLIEKGIKDLSLMNSDSKYVISDASINIHTMNSRSMFVDAIPQGMVWDSYGVFCNMTVAIKHIAYVTKVNGSLVSICFYTNSIKNCL